MSDDAKVREAGPWTKCSDSMPPPHSRYEFRFVGTPCYGAHLPWIVMHPEMPAQIILDVQVPLLEWRPLRPPGDNTAGHAEGSARVAELEAEVAATPAGELREYDSAGNCPEE
jgi:hypothetical protein